MRNLNSGVKGSFCQQVDDWILLKITEPVKRGLPTFSSLLSTVIWVKNCRSKKGLKQCLGGLKCSQNTKKNKKTLKVSFKAIFNVHFANCYMNN